MKTATFLKMAPMGRLPVLVSQGVLVNLSLLLDFKKSIIVLLDPNLHVALIFYCILSVILDLVWVKVSREKNDTCV